MSQALSNLGAAITDFFGAAGGAAFEIIVLVLELLLLAAVVALPFVIGWVIWRKLRHQPVLPRRFQRGAQTGQSASNSSS